MPCDNEVLRLWSWKIVQAFLSSSITNMHQSQKVSAILSHTEQFSLYLHNNSTGGRERLVFSVKVSFLCVCRAGRREIEILF